jgi:DNA-binding response OmpR family regulator
VIEKARELMLAAGLSKTEQAVFACLATKPNELVRRGEVLAVLKGSAAHTIDSHIMAIRRKLRHHGQDVSIETVTGLGFILRMPSSAEAL